MSQGERGLTVAVTGPTGTFGFGLIPLLQADERIARIIGIARRPFDPAEYGWTKLEYRRGDVRDPAALREAFEAADVVVHLAFLITGAAPADELRAVNVEGTLNAFRAAAAAGARRFVYASSVAAYGFHPDNPVGMTEDWPVRPAARLFYAKEKAELEHLLQAEATKSQTAAPALYLLRPPIVLGPHALGAKDLLPGPLAPLGRGLARLATRAGQAARAGRIPRFPVLVPSMPFQCVHEDDLGDAFLRCIVAAGPPGAYNVAADGMPHQRGRGPRVRPAATTVACGTHTASGPDHRRAAVPAARRAVGRGRQPSGHHGHHQGEERAGLDSPPHRSRSPARYLRPGWPPPRAGYDAQSLPPV